MRAAVLLAGVAGLAVARQAGGQFLQYISPGSLGVAPLSTQEQLAKAMGDARWRLGALRLQPVFELRDIAYIDNVFGSQTGKTSDVTATLGAGLKAYLPIGRKVVLAANALPEYSWWRDLSQLRGWHYRTAAGLFGYFNHLTLEASATGRHQQGYLSAQFDSPVEVRQRQGDVRFKLDLAGPFSLFGEGAASRWDFSETHGVRAFPADVDLLNRREESARAGVKYSLHNGLTWGVGAEYSQVEFERSARALSNSGTAPVLEVEARRARWGVLLDAAYRSLKPRGDSAFPRYRDLSGLLRLNLNPRGKIAFSLYGAQNLVYSLLEETPYFVDRRGGVEIDFIPGAHFDLRLYGELGNDQYKDRQGGDATRQDRYHAAGADLVYEWRTNVTAYAGLTSTRYDSNLPGFDRRLTVLRAGFHFASSQPGW